MKKGIIFILLLAGSFYGSAQSTGNYKIKFLEVNKNNSDNGVAILDNNKLIFTSAEEEAKSSRRNYNPKKNLFIGDIDYDGEIINIKPVMNKNHSGYNETGISFTNNNKTVYFSRNKYVNKRSKQKLAKNQRLELFKAKVNKDGSWSNIKKLPFNKKTYSSGYPVLSSDNSKLYFVSDRLPSEGKTDIFVVDILKNGKFSKPRNLGKNVNTSGNETTPFITEDEILYFSSDGHPGKGKLDVYAVEIYEGSTSEIYQLAAPINSVNDDFAYIVNKDNNQGFFTSNRLQGQGFNDLYAFILKEDVRPEDCFITVDGKVRDKDSFEAIPGATVNLYNLKGNLLESVLTYDDGTYKFTVSCDKEYKLIASNDNYRNDEKRIEILEENYHTALHTNLVLSKIHKETPVYEDKPLVESLQPIYYDFDDATITDKAAKEMDKIVKIMKDNTNLIIEASAFTDSRGSDAYNIVLSQKRAKAAVDYLRSQGVDPIRIKSKGYGENRLINQCVNGVDCKESAHQMNRRTEFNFVNIEAGISKKKLVKKKNELVEKTKKPDTKDSKKITKPIEISKDVGEVAQVREEVKDKEPEVLNKNSNNIVQADIKDETPSKNQVREEIKDKEPEALNKNSNNIVQADIKDETPSKNQVKEEVNGKEPEALNKNSNNIVQTDNKDITPSNNQVKEEVIVNYNSSIVATNKESNKALNYIEKERIKVIDKLTVLEKKFEVAINEYINVSGSLKIEKDKISKVIESAQNLEETGWSNILEYKNFLLLFNKRYNHLTGENNRYNQITQINGLKSFNNLNDKTLLSSAEINDKEILEENLRVTNMDVVAMKMNSRGIYQKTNNAKKTELIKVSFKLEHNDKVNSGKKNAYIVLQDPEGKVAQAKGIFKLKDSDVEKKYTDHAIIDYNKNDIDVTVYIQKKGNNLTKGVYPVKLFLEGQLVSVSSLDLLNPF